MCSGKHTPSTSVLKGKQILAIVKILWRSIGQKLIPSQMHDESEAILAALAQAASRDFITALVLNTQVSWH